MGVGATYRELGESAWSWTLAQARDDDGPWFPEQVVDGPVEPVAVDRDALYCGIAGLAPVLAEVALARPLTAEESGLAAAVVERLQRVSVTTSEASLYVGTAGHAWALQLLGADPGPALRRLVDTVGPRGWPSDGFDHVNDVIGGTAGIMLAGVESGRPEGLEVAALGADRLLAAADRTDHGLSWPMAREYPSLMPNFSHGTAGAAAALAVAGTALGRDDLVHAAVEGAQHLVATAELDDDGFVLPMVIPAQEDRERVTFGWCHGPTGTSYLFAALTAAGVDEVARLAPVELRARCIRSVLRSGVPQRLRPGFWDNDGRCCGTAGVGEMLLDAAQDADDPAYAAQMLDAAVVMADAVVDRAITDGRGTRWRFVEHRDDDPLLPPSTTWMQGASGIAAFLLRLARVLDDGLGAPAVVGPDRWFAVPAEVRAPR